MHRSCYRCPPLHLRRGSGSGAICQRATHRFCGRGGFSSAYFTEIKYGSKKKITGYWESKFARLALRILIINCFLITFLLLKKEEGVFSWHSLVHILGGTGFLNWFHITNQSPLGAGLWFLTLLFLFYSIYPIFRFYIDRVTDFPVVLYGYGLMFILQFYFPMGHMLWLTSFSFIWGMFCAKNAFSPKAATVIAVFSVICTALLFLLNLSGVKQFNFFLISMISLGVPASLVGIKIPASVVMNKFFRFISDHMLEIYFIHGYLFIHPFSNQVTDFSLTLLLIMGVSWLLLKVSLSLQIIIMRKYEDFTCIRS